MSLKVKASPADAKIYLDGVLLGGGSFDGKVQRGEQTRVLRVEAEGHAPQEEKVALTSDLVMSFALEKLASVQPTASVTATSRPGVVPKPKQPGPGIDSQSPYGGP